MTTVSGYAKILVTLQRDGKPDDVLFITPDYDSDGYYGSFRQRTIHNTTQSYFENDALISYLETFLTSLLFDRDCPDFIQIDVPMYSTVLLTRNTVLGYFSLLRTQIESLQDDWPFEKYREQEQEQ